MSARLRRECISIAPISRLPPELLSLIFCHVRRVTAREWEGLSGAFESPYDFHQRFEVTEWVKFSHVCHAWREVALSTVSLWSHLTVGSSDYKWAEECLRRSKESSLVLFADFPEGESNLNTQDPSRALLRELRNHVGRCRVLSLRLTTGDLTNLLSQAETPHLVHFHYSHISNRNSFTGLRSPPPCINDSILRADSLRRLSISRCPVDWSASIFHRLTHLQLSYIPEESRLNCRAFVYFLVGIPSLQGLDLCGSLRKGNSDASHVGGNPSDGPHLQYLKYVELTEDPAVIAGFLSSLLIPPLCKVIINGEGYPDMTAEEFLPALSWVYNQFHPPTSGSSTAIAHQNYWRSLRIFHLESYFGFQGYTIEENLERDDILFEHCIWLPDRSDVDDVDVENLPQLLFTPLPISHIVYLEIETDSDFSVLSKSMWIAIFGSISTLESIYIGIKSLPFFEALSHDPGNLLFPVLSSVIVQGYRPNYEAVLRSLRWRSQLGVPLKRLVIERCLIVPSSVQRQLREVVGQVEVIDHRAFGSTTEVKRM